MKLLNLLIVILLFKMATHIGMNIGWYWWVVVAIFYCIDLQSQAATANNVVVVGENIRTIGNWLVNREEKKKENGEEIHSSEHTIQ